MLSRNAKPKSAERYRMGDKTGGEKEVEELKEIYMV